MIKSKKIRESARGEDCTLRLGFCSSNETVVLCHIGKRRGMGLKCSDTFAIYSCASCHDVIDRRVKSTFSNDELNTQKLRALEETQELLIRKELLVVK